MTRHNQQQERHDGHTQSGTCDRVAKSRDSYLPRGAMALTNKF